jgi:spoIIIJ-associated protein
VEWVEVTGETVAEAKDRALDRLGVDEADAEFEVIEEPQKSFFGRVKGEARVRARVRPTAPRPKAERQDRRRRNGRGGRTDGDGEAKDTSADSDATDTDVDAETELPAPARGRDAGDAGERPRRARSTAPRSETDAPREGGRESNSRDSGQRRGRDDSSIPAFDGPQEELVATFLEGLVEAYGFNASVKVGLEDERFVATIDGAGLGVLIGPRGRTSLAAQEVTRAYVQRRVAEGLDRPVVVDVAGYRGRRRAALLAFVDQVAEEVKEHGQGAALEPMSSVDRKFVHDRVAELAGVSSASVGDDPRRRVVIDPAD